MPKSLVAVRPISDAEAAVVERVLDVAAVTDDAPALRTQVRSLQVISRCGCGCATIGFKHLTEGDRPGRMVADASGKAPDGDVVGIIVWAFGPDLAELEIYNYSERAARLPALTSIRGWDGTVTAA